MNLPANHPVVTATVELRTTVTVTVPLPDGVMPVEVDEAGSAVDAIAALPPALKASLKAAATAADDAERTLADIHYIWAC